MADISQEIDQLRNAVYGEEVRGAFISCMQKIHEENESYNFHFPRESSAYRR